MIKRFNLCSLCGLLALVLISTPALAQESQSENVTVIEIDEDGTVTVNGEVVDGDGTVTIRSKYDGGNETVRVFSRDGTSLSNTFTRSQRGNADRLRRRLEREAGNANGNFYLFRDRDNEEGGAETLRGLFSGNGNAFWIDDEDGSFNYEVFSENTAENVFGNAMRLGGPSFEFGQEQLKSRMEVMKLEREAAELAQQVRRASADERAELEADLDAQLDAIFERKMELRQAEIDMLEERLAKERNAFEQRTTERKRMVERRKRELLGERDALDW